MRSIIALALFATSVAWASSPSPHHYIDWEMASPMVKNEGAEQKVLFTESVKVDGATWLRLFFDQGTRLSRSSSGSKTVLRITSKLDGAQQILDWDGLVHWQFSSAFFNGDEVTVELLGDPGADAARVGVRQVMVGEPEPSPESICGPVDDRTLETDPRAARLFPVGCTAWLIDDEHGCFLSAGHCFDGGGSQVAEFNVPLSNGDGSLNHPGPEDQYPMDEASLQWDLTVIGNDWGYFGTFPNANTDLTAAEAAGSTYVLGTPPGSASGETIRITGYGSVSGTQGTPVTWNQVQTTHTGPLTSVSGTILRYATDTTGGNSGSAVVNESDGGVAIGIHTNAGCSAGGGANQGTSLLNAGLQAALASPSGLCDSGPPSLKLAMVTNVMDPVDPAGGDTLEILVTDRDGQPATPSSATLVYDNGNGEQSVPFATRGTNLTVAFPALECAQEVRYRVDVEPSMGSTIRLPYSVDNTESVQYVRTVGDTFDGTFSDDMETDMGWTVDDDPGLTDGTWERGTPIYGFRNDPGFDADGSGQAFLTHAEFGNTDVDGGATRLVSPTLDASAADATITYWRWFSVGGTVDDDFLVEVSDDDGANWVTLETVVGPGAEQWHQSVFRVGDFVNNTNQFRIRFTAVDGGAGSIVEAGVDGVKLYNDFSGTGCDLIFADGFNPAM